MENAGTPVMLLKTLLRGQSIVYKGRLLVGRNILLRLAVKASFVSKEEEEEDCSQNTTGVGFNGSDSRNTDVNIVDRKMQRISMQKRY